MELGTDHRDDPQVINDPEQLQPITDPLAADPLSDQELIEEARTARFAAMLAAVQSANTAMIVASSVSLLVGVGIGIAIGRTRP